MAKSRLYLDSTILITFVFGSKLEPDKFDCVSRLFNYENIDLVTSLYALIELYNYPIFNFEMDEQEKRLLAKSAIISALLTETEIVPMLPRAIRSYYNNTFKMVKSPLHPLKLPLRILNQPDVEQFHQKIR